MKKFYVCTLILAGLTLSACQTTVRSPELEIDGPGGVEIKVKDGDQSKDGKFCPPGQAKKGNC